MTKTFWYLASPYSRYPYGIEAAFQDVAFNAGLLINAGVKIFCPISHSHPISIYGHVPYEAHEIWLPADQPFIDLAHGMILLEMEGWQTSYGVNYEIEQFTKAGKPIVRMQPGIVPSTELAMAEEVLRPALSSGSDPSVSPPRTSRLQQHPLRKARVPQGGLR